jgi:hypothetical protein
MSSSIYDDRLVIKHRLVSRASRSDTLSGRVAPARVNYCAGGRVCCVSDLSFGVSGVAAPISGPQAANLIFRPAHFGITPTCTIVLGSRTLPLYNLVTSEKIARRRLSEWTAPKCRGKDVEAVA